MVGMHLKRTSVGFDWTGIGYLSRGASCTHADVAGSNVRSAKHLQLIDQIAKQGFHTVTSSELGAAISLERISASPSRPSNLKPSRRADPFNVL